MNHILLITSSPRGVESLSTRLATEIAQGLHDRLGGALTVRDLAADPLPHISSDYIQGRMVPPTARTPDQAEAVAIAQTLVDELLASEVIVIGSGMINFGLSSQLKAWVDHVTWPGITFSYGVAGPKGLVSGKKIYLVTTAGGIFSEGPAVQLDFHTPYLLHLLGFIGLSEVELVRVEGVVLGSEVANAAIAGAELTVRSILKKVA